MQAQGRHLGARAALWATPGCCAGLPGPLPGPLLGLFLGLLLGLCMAAFAAPAQAAQTIYVGTGGSPGDGQSADRPLGSINAAFKKARKGDVIVVAPGEYRESIQVTVSGVTVQSSVSEENIPLVNIFAPAGKSVSVLTDSADTLWRGVGFHIAGRAAVVLRGFGGRFERCLFASESSVPGMEV